jgi:hypothetical protein
MFINQLIRLSSEDDTEIIKAKDDELVKSHIPYVVHASTSSARTEYQ